MSEAKTVNPDEFREIIWRDENETIPVKQNKVIVFLFFNLFFLKIENSHIIKNMTKLFSNALKLFNYNKTKALLSIFKL